RRQHQNAGFYLRFGRQRNVHRHLVAIEVGVECRADQWVDFNCFAFHEHWLKSLNAQAMERRGPVQHDRMVLDDLFQNVPDDRFLLFHHFFCLFDGGAVARLFETVIDERLEQLERHLLGQSALMQLELGTNDDDRTSGVVHPLAEQVLAETSLFALQRVGERLQWTVIGATQNTPAASVVEQSVDRFLQHALFVAHDDFGSVQVHQFLQPVVAVDDAAIQIIQIGGGEAPAIQWNQRTQFGWNHRQHIQDHPLRLVAALAEGLNYFQPLRILQALLQRGFVLHLLAQFARERIDFNPFQQFLDRFRAHHGLEAGGAILLVKFAVLGFVLDDFALFHRRVAGIDDHVGLEIQNGFQIAQGNVEQMPDAAGKALSETPVRTGRGPLDVPQALAAYF